MHLKYKDMPHTKNLLNLGKKITYGFFAKIDILFHCVLLASLTICLVNPDMTMKIFMASTLLAIIMASKNRHDVLRNKRYFILPAMFLLFSIMQLIWVGIFKTPGTHFSGAYRSYQNGGKVMFCGALTLLALQSSKISTIKHHITQYWVILTAIGLYLFAGYQAITAKHPLSYRVTLGFEHATGTAYILTLVALLASQVIINLHTKKSIYFYLLHFSVSFIAIIATQTRAAILVYPLLSMVLFFLHYRHHRTLLMRALLAFLILTILAAIPLKSVIEKRYHNTLHDLHSYSKHNSNTSIGARFAMQKVGLYAGKQHLFGQSLEQRSIEANVFSQQDISVKGALKYLNVHLHNELIDTFSLKGVPGVIVLILLYAAMFLTTYLQRNPIICVISVAIALYGLSDVLFYAKGEALGCTLTLCVATMMRKNSREI